MSIPSDVTPSGTVHGHSDSDGPWPSLEGPPSPSSSSLGRGNVVDGGGNNDSGDIGSGSGSWSRANSAGSVGSGWGSGSVPLGTDGLQATLQQIAMPDNGREQLNAATYLLKVCQDERNKREVGQMGAIELLVALLRRTVEEAHPKGSTSTPTTIPAHPLPCVALETLALLASESSPHRDAVRRAGGVPLLLRLLNAPLCIAYRALLAVRVFTEREVDRQAVLLCGGLPKIVAILLHQPPTHPTPKEAQTRLDMLENVAAAVGNLAAGSQALKNGLREARVIAPLVGLLDDGEVLAELAAVALRNLSLRNKLNRQAILDEGGLEPLLRLLSKGQHRLATYFDCSIVWSDGAEEKATCWFDISYGQLHVAPQSSMAGKQGLLSTLFSPRGTQQRPDPSTANIYSLLDKFRVSEPATDTLELKFHRRRGGVATPGVAPIRPGAGRSTDLALSQLAKVLIRPCPATEIKGAILKMMTRVHLEREFRYGDATATPRAAGPLSERASLSIGDQSLNVPPSSDIATEGAERSGSMTARPSAPRRSTPLSASLPDWKTLKSALFQTTTPPLDLTTARHYKAGPSPANSRPGSVKSTPREAPPNGPALVETTVVASRTPASGRPPKMPSLTIGVVASQNGAHPCRSPALTPKNHHASPKASKRAVSVMAKENRSPAV